MEYKSIPPVYGMNRLLWAHIVAAGYMDKANYSVNGLDLIPIIPTQEEPQFISAMDSQAGVMSYPYIVYNWYTNTIRADEWWQQTDNVTYTIYAIDQKLHRDLTLLVTDLFKRYDESAQMVNSYVALAYPPGVTPDPFVDGPSYPGYEYRCYQYNYIYVVSVSPVLPTAENDPNKVTITLRVNYTDSRNSKQLTVPPIPS